MVAIAIDGLEDAAEGELLDEVVDTWFGLGDHVLGDKRDIPSVQAWPTIRSCHWDLWRRA
jgi:hypothetical protein